MLIEILNILTWPVVTLVLAFRFGSSIEKLLPSSKLKLVFAGIEIETTPAELTAVIQETYRHGKITPAQWSWLERLSTEHAIKYDHKNDYAVLKPLRNSGMIREHPEGWLSNCETVSISPLGAFLLKSYKPLCGKN
jgi:hypothetical protein